MELEKLKSRIQKAHTKQELKGIAFDAFLCDNYALQGNHSLFNKVVTLCVMREEELGLL